MKPHMNLDLIQERYGKLYEEIQYLSTTGKASNFYHRKMEWYSQDEIFDNVLEVGSGSGEHLRFVNHNFKKYIISDLRMPTLCKSAEEIVARRNHENEVIELRAINVENIAFSDSVFERVVSTCVLHHVENPYRALMEMRRVVTHDGMIDLYIPSDPGIIYRIAQHLVSTRAMKNHFSSSEIKFLRASEHRNHVASLSGLIKGVFSGDEISTYSFPKINLGWNTRLFQIYSIKVKKL
jgi:phosphatidylethanolamine/phosphatidyl-N-methylethanolamine N-methyltransferase